MVQRVWQFTEKSSQKKIYPSKKYRSIGNANIQKFFRNIKKEIYTI